MGQRVPELVWLDHKPRRLETEKGLLETGPLRLEHAPGEAS
jgi:hypothetical protein